MDRNLEYQLKSGFKSNLGINGYRGLKIVVKDNSDLEFVQVLK